MAAITAAQVQTLYWDQVGATKFEILRITDVGTGDTIDVSAIGNILFHRISVAGFAASIQLVVVNCAGSIVGTVITLTNAGMANDTVHLMIIGV